MEQRKWDYEKAVSYIEGIPRFAKEKSMESLQRILDHFHDPQESFVYIHVAGTNGKGSVCSYLERMLRESGAVTGLFTSPHLVCMRERIRIRGQMVSEEAFVEAFEEVYDFVREAAADPSSPILHPTFFEWIYLMAMLLFAKAGIRYGVIETGLGGRLDASNVIRRPALTVISSISLDHTQYLGNTIPQIASEKAGIIKEGVPLICDASDPQALQVLYQTAQEKKAPCTLVFSDRQALKEAARSVPVQARFMLVKNILNQGKNIDFYLQEMYHDTDYALEEGRSLQISLPTAASYQAVNASLAYLAFEALSAEDRSLASVSEDWRIRAMALTRWPARMEEILPGVLIDGAHNLAGAQALFRSLEAAWPDRPLVLLFAASWDKDCRQMIRVLAGLSGLRAVVTTAVKSERAASGHELQLMFEEETGGRIPCRYKEGVKEAFFLARSLAPQDALLVCAGSLYMAGELQEALQAELILEKEVREE